MRSGKSAAFLLLSLTSTLQAAVTLTDSHASYTLSNSHLAATIDKRTAGLTSLRYHGQELLGLSPGRPTGYWSLASDRPNFPRSPAPTISIDPTTNAGACAAVSLTFHYDGNDHTIPADITLTYALASGESALYLAGAFTHKPDYPALSFAVGRFAAKLNASVFDFMTIDERRRKVMPAPSDWLAGTQLNMKEARRLNTGRYKGDVEHKYDYAAVQFDTPAYGWSSTEHRIGLWLINPSFEYMSGGPTKVELTAHLDAAGNDAFPTLLNVWKGPHYGGTVCDVAQGESWSRTIGPFLLYCNAAHSHDAMWHDALARAKSESAAWPYDWYHDPHYVRRSDRTTVAGHLILNEGQLTTNHQQLTNLLVGLTHPDYPDGDETIDWQRDGKYPQYWTRANPDGSFAVANLPPGTYTLHAFSSNVLGEFSKSDISVPSARPLDLGALAWTPKRFGQQLWDIGTPDRTAGEFRHGDDYWHWGLYNLYPAEFPNDVHFTIGQSDPRKGWNYCQPPRVSPDGKVSPAPWTISFNLDHAPTSGTATLRLAFCGSRGRNNHVTLSVNNHDAGDTGPLPDDGVMHRDSIRGYWFERDLPFPATLLHQGQNSLTLTPHPRAWPDGILYDYLRLELNESKETP